MKHLLPQLLLVTGLLLIAESSHATAAIEFGSVYNIDQTEHSLRDSYGIMASLRNTAGTSFVRPHIGIEAFYSDSSLRTGGTAYEASTVGQNTLLGLEIYPFEKDAVSPFFSGSALFGLSFIRAPAAPSGEGRVSSGLHYGYEASGGARFRSGSKSSIFLRGAYRNIRRKYAERSLQMNNLSMTLGFSF